MTASAMHTGGFCCDEESLIRTSARGGWNLVVKVERKNPVCCTFLCKQAKEAENDESSLVPPLSIPFTQNQS